MQNNTWTLDTGSRTDLVRAVSILSDIAQSKLCNVAIRKKRNEKGDV